MRPILFAAFLCALVLAGCGGQPAATATVTPVPPTLTAVPATQTEVSQGNNDIGTLAATVGAPQPGTLVIDTNQKTPNAPTDVPIVFTDLVFTRTGGIAATTTTIELKGDGTLIRDGKISQVSADDVKKIAAMLDTIHFFSMQGVFVSPAGSADAYRYSLSVSAPAGSQTINSMDGLTPQPLADIYDAIRALGTS